MAITRLSDFTGGAIGSNPTVTSEPWATSAGGTATNMTYEAGIAGTSGQSVQVTEARDFVWTTPGSRWRLGMWVNRVSGTQSAGLACMLLRAGTANQGDLFLRNQNGGQFALRAGVGGTVYAGQSTTTVTNGSVWWVELEYNAQAVTVSLWEPGNSTTTPNSTFSSTTNGVVDNVRLFNPTGTTGLTMRFGELFTSSGEQIRSALTGSGSLVLSGSAARSIMTGRVAVGSFAVDGGAVGGVSVVRGSAGTAGVGGAALLGGVSVDRSASGALSLGALASPVVSVDRSAVGALGVDGDAHHADAVIRAATVAFELVGLGLIKGQPFPVRLTLVADAITLELTATVPQLTLEAAW